MWCAAPILACREAPVVYKALKDNSDLPWVMSFHLLHSSHLPRLVAIVAKFFICEIKVSNFIYLLVILSFSLNISINNQGRQHQMLKKRPIIK